MFTDDLHTAFSEATENLEPSREVLMRASTSFARSQRRRRIAFAAVPGMALAGAAAVMVGVAVQPAAHHSTTAGHRSIATGSTQHSNSRSSGVDLDLAAYRLGLPATAVTDSNVCADLQDSDCVQPTISDAGAAPSTAGYTHVAGDGDHEIYARGDGDDTLLLVHMFLAPRADPDHPVHFWIHVQLPGIPVKQALAWWSQDDGTRPMIVPVN